jgi:hypothetical protein
VEVGDLNQTESGSLLDRVVSILEQARAAAVRTINTQMTVAYWLVGREIVEEEQRGETRAAYGAGLIDDLSSSLGQRYGRGFSVANLRNFRQFYLCYPDRLTTCPAVDNQDALEKRYTLCSESWGNAITAKTDLLNPSARNIYGFAPELSWSHYRLLMRVENGQARLFYEIETARNRWSVRQLSRQINSLLFERLAASRDREGVLRLANEGQVVETPVDAIKDPYSSSLNSCSIRCSCRDSRGRHQRSVRPGVSRSARVAGLGRNRIGEGADHPSSTVPTGAWQWVRVR